MKRMLRLEVVLAAVCVAVFAAGTVCAVSAQKKQMSNEEIQAEIQRLEQKKQQEQAKRAQAAEASRPSGQDLNQIVDRYEKLLEQCAVKKNDLCADVMYTLGSLYYDQGKDNYAKAVERHADELKAYERTGSGTAPMHPIPDYSKSLKMYWQLTREYPTFPKLPEAYFQMSVTYLAAGNLDTTRIILDLLVRRFPNSQRVSAANFRLADLAFMDNNYNKAYQHLQKVKRDQINPVSWEMTHYRMGECAYNLGDFDKAVEYFHGYVEACDRGEYQKKGFREMALEYMAISFADMPDGVKKAIKFFKKNKGKPYEKQIMNMIEARKQAE